MRTVGSSVPCTGTAGARNALFPFISWLTRLCQSPSGLGSLDTGFNLAFDTNAFVLIL